MSRHRGLQPCCGGPSRCKRACLPLAGPHPPLPQLACPSLAPAPRRSPLKEVLFAIRAILPLVVALCLLIGLVLRRGLPETSWAVEGRDGDAASEAPTEDASVRSGTASVGRPSMGRRSATPNKYDALYRASMAVAAAQLPDDGSASGGDTPRDDTAHGPGTASVASSAKMACTDSGQADAEAGAAGPGAAAAEQEAPPRGSCVSRFFSRYGAFLGAVAVTQLGMIAFNIGERGGEGCLGGGRAGDGPGPTGINIWWWRPSGQQERGPTLHQAPRLLPAPRPTSLPSLALDALPAQG